MYDSSGRLQQVEWAELASQKGASVVAFACDSNIVVLSPTQPHDKLIDRRSLDKVEKIDDEIWSVCTGLAGDGRSIVQTSREFTSKFREGFGVKPSAMAVAAHVGSHQHQGTLYEGKD